MSIINATVDSAIAIAERRRGKLGAGVYSGRSRVVLERGLYALKSSTWMVVASGFVEPVFYLLAFGYGIGQFISGVTDGNGNPITYAQFIAPALLATSAMNGAIYDSTWNVFFKMHFGKVYNGMLSTSMGTLDVALGEISWALLRGLAYAIGFMAVVSSMGLVPSLWGLLAIPASVLIAFGFASVGMGVTSYLKNHQQMQWVQLVMLPMFLFSGTFYPLTIYPVAVQYFIQAMPLWQAIQLVRGLTLGNLDIAMLGHILYFVVMIIGGLYFTTRRLTALFLK
ncbi:MAG: ABC transporter [Micrococcales bacterium]|nr:ABC transporter [Micrococcales bacterium]NBR54531.1 ABC transporter [Micrococcales bacterium]NBR61088.1 ABC transporter [Actinomycetota bacterium]NBT46554.1 ABC transporter [Actinomycetota bacterium]NBY43887.1 ABC transporter [Micrococcales bacterium]